MHFVIKSYDSFLPKKKLTNLQKKNPVENQFKYEISRICLLDRHSPMQKIIVLNSKRILVCTKKGGNPT